MQLTWQVVSSITLTYYSYRNLNEHRKNHIRKPLGIYSYFPFVLFNQTNEILFTSQLCWLTTSTQTASLFVRPHPSQAYLSAVLSSIGSAGCDTHQHWQVICLRSFQVGQDYDRFFDVGWTWLLQSRSHRWWPRKLWSSPESVLAHFVCVRFYACPVWIAF